MAIELCRLTDIPDGGARGFRIGAISVLALRQHGGTYVYLNRCPHMGVPLEWEKDRFLDDDGALIRCATHGALFAKETGECLQGPCRGESLWEIEHRLEDGRLLIDEDELDIFDQA